MIKRTPKSIFAAGMALLLPLGTLAGQDSNSEEIIDDNAEKCVNVTKIRRTHVVDDRTVLFYMRGKKAYLNILPRACNGLAREQSFSYRTFSRRLCAVDSIQVLQQGTFQGTSCSLGAFIAISREEANALKDTEPKEAPPAPVPLPEPEEIGDDSESSQES